MELFNNPLNIFLLLILLIYCGIELMRLNSRIRKKGFTGNTNPANEDHKFFHDTSCWFIAMFYFFLIISATASYAYALLYIIEYLMVPIQYGIWLANKGYKIFKKMYKLKITRPWKIAGMKIFRFNIPDIGVGMGYFILAILIWFATLIYFVILLLFYGVILILTSFVPSRIFDLLVEQKLLPGYNYLYNCEAKN